MNLDDLKRPFPFEEIEWRVGATNQDKTQGMALAYIDARAAMERLDAVCGPEGWQDRYPHAAQKTCCEIGINVNGEWVWKSDGAGDTDFEGDKGAFSDAFKRAAARWGVARYLYGLKTPWVPIEQRGKSFAIANESYRTLRQAYRTAVWVGPLTVTELKERVREFSNALRDCSSPDMVDDLVTAYQDVLNQLGSELDMDEWYQGTLEAIEGAREGCPVAVDLPEDKPKPKNETKPALIPVGTTDDGADWKGWAQSLVNAFRTTNDATDLNAWLKVNEVPLRNLKKASAKAHKHVMEQAEKRRHFHAQQPSQAA